MPADDQRGHPPRSSKPGFPIKYKFPEAELGIQWGSEQDTDYATYVEPNNNRVRRQLAMPTVIRLLYDKTTFDTAPPAGYQYSGTAYEEDPDFDVYSAALSLGLNPPPPPYGIENPPPYYLITFQNFMAVYDLDTMGFVFYYSGTPPRIPAYIDLGNFAEDIVSGDPNPAITEPPPNTPVKYSYVRIQIAYPGTTPLLTYYYDSCQGATGNGLIATPFNGPGY